MSRLHIALVLASAPVAMAQVPVEVQLPGTQPLEVVALDDAGNCLSCHAGYDPAHAPGDTWRGSMMAHAGRDPLYWATLAVAEADFPGAGDLCLRCHSSQGWIAGRSTPTDGSGLAAADDDGVTCTVCHRMVNPDGSEHPGVQLPPYVANDGGSPPVGWYGSGELVYHDSKSRLGPYANVASPHTSLPSAFHRDPAYCASCHDVSNPVTGDLAPTNGSMLPLPAGTFDGQLGGVVADQAAFRHAPFAYGVTERTASEHFASAWDTYRVSDYPVLPADLRRGAVEAAYLAATAGVPSGDYADGAPRSFICQTCHMPASVAKGAAKKAAPLRLDLAVHDLTGGSTWIQDAMVWQDDHGTLPFGGGLDASVRAALAAGQARARANLARAAALDVTGDAVRVTNLTGHKLISGYPEGRRLWLQVRFFGPSGEPLRVDGAYGPLQVTHLGAPLTVDSLLDLDDPYLVIYEAFPGLSQAWAAKLLALGYAPGLPLEYDRLTGAVAWTLGDLAAQPTGTVWKSFRFALNDAVATDTRIPPWGMAHDEALVRSTLPVPASQYGDPGPGGVYDHFHDVALAPPVGAATAELELLYQSTSWEYVQFLALADPDQSAFLDDVGQELLDAWLATGMSAPETVATAAWTAAPGDCDHDGVPDAVEIAGGTEPDCDGDGVLDACQLALDPAADLDGDGGLDRCQWLSADVAQLSVASGGTQALALHAGAAHAGELAWVFGSTTGTSPGYPVPGAVLPLTFDPYLQFTLAHPGAAPVLGGFGFLDGAGSRSAAFALPGGLDPSYVGVTAWHAFAAVAVPSLVVTGVSNPVRVELAP